MNVFELDTEILGGCTEELRRDAAALRPLPPVTLHPGGLTHAFVSTVRHAINTADNRAAGLSYEVCRVADAMDLTSTAAHAVETRTSSTLGELL